VSRRGCRIEQRVAGPHVVDVIDTEMRVLEQVSGLSVDLKRILVAEEIRIELFLTHPLIVLQAITTCLTSLAGRSHTGI
jgi:hypothetical protein